MHVCNYIVYIYSIYNSIFIKFLQFLNDSSEYVLSNIYSII